jgi:asparagine synthase (glutamine-hydrolysing)
MAPLKIKTFSIGFENSPDLYYARQVAEHIGSIHSECIITEEIAISAINSVIYTTETFDVTTVRASIMMYLLSKHINETSDVVVVFSGEGSDEASGSYRYFHNAPSLSEFNAECERLLMDLHLFDNLRVNKTSAAFGLEARIPFLDLKFINYYMTVPCKLKTQRGIKKFLFRKAFIDMLPESIINRPKEAMSDGVSHLTRSWSEILQGEAVRITGIYDRIYAERELYLSIFNNHYDGCDHQIPYYWLPRWCGDIKDPSARTLSFYNGSVL